MPPSNGQFHEEVPQAIVATAVIPEHALALQRTPDVVIEEARRAAKALADVIERKAKKVIINGEIYLEFEDWQTLGRFYGVTAAASSTQYVEYGDVVGYEAKAEALLLTNGQTVRISSAEAMCLNDEWKWSEKPLFQLKSMAQTRAMAKVLRNVLAWVVVLAGYKPTPAEELDGEQKPEINAPRRRSQTPTPPAPQAQQSVEPPQRRSDNFISDGQINRLYAIARDKGYTKTELHAWLAKCGFASAKEIPKPRYQDIANGLLGVN